MNKTVTWMPHQVRHDIKLGVLLAGLLTIANAANIAYVAKTGPGATGAGDNVGKQWPTVRFVVSGDCVIDNLTGLMWAKNGIIGFEATNGGGLIPQPDYNNTTANLNSLSWSQAVTAINNINTASSKLCGYSDWRLPNINELKSMVNYAASQNGSNPAAWLNAQGFTNVQQLSYDSNYWSSTIYDSTSIWTVTFGVGLWGSIPASIDSYVWPVRGGQ